MRITDSQVIKSAEWISPSNIAFVKYWGKHGNQLPANPSLSMTLKNSCTRTIVSLMESGDQGSINFFFGEEAAPDFEPGIIAFLSKVDGYFPFLKEKSLKIESWNNFPHSAGIASSASSMSALALCLCDISAQLSKSGSSGDEFYRQASGISRIGSGSASRSVLGQFAVWGKTPLLINSSDEYAVSLDFKVNPAFSELQDTILIVNSSRKKISSSHGHKLMDTHPFARERYKLAEDNLSVILNAMKSGNTDDFIKVVENEALVLHSLMMSSDPGFILIEPGTLAIIDKIRDYREKSGRFLCFTLDAGPNVHLVYPKSEKPEIINFIKDELISFCENGKFIRDECGNGPEKTDSVINQKDKS